MSSTIKAAARRRSHLLASSLLLAALALGFSAAKAQQSASPNLLPTIEVVAPGDKNRPRSEPIGDRPTASRRVVPTTQRAPADAQQTGVSSNQLVVVSPTATETPIDQIASSVTVITAKD